ncbi:hypothetical protein ACB092_11G037800 [Castanea dentata]
MQLAWTCYNFYQSTPTKLAGENYFFHSGQVSYTYSCDRQCFCLCVSVLHYIHKYLF